MEMIFTFIKIHLFMKYLFFLLLINFACHSQNYNGKYCAKVDYENFKTGTKSTYNLTIDVENNTLKSMQFPNGGELNENEINDALISNGKTKFKYNNKSYEVKILSKGNDCLRDVPEAIQCKGITKKGYRCKNKTDNENIKCHVHQ